MKSPGRARRSLATSLAAVAAAISLHASAGTLGTESPDYNNTIGDPTLVVASAGAHTVTGTIGSSPGDTQDQFSVQIPASLQVTSISYSGKTSDDNGNPMPLSANGCGFSSINQTLTTPASSCTIDFNISGNFLVSSYGWTVTVNTQALTNAAPTASSFSASQGPYEDLTYTFATSNFSYSDGDGDPLSHVRITSLPGAGTLYVDADNDNTLDAGEALATNGTVSKANLDAGNLQYIQNGSTNTSFSFDVNDGTDYSSSTYTATLNVTARPTVTLSISPTSRTESVTTANAVTATLSNAYGAPVTVNLAFGGTATLTSDYTRSANSISISAGNTTNSIVLTNVPDALFEGNETVVVDISSVTNGTESGTQQATYTITDDDTQPTATLELATSAGGPFTGITAANITDESGGQLYVVAKLSAASGLSTTVPITFSGTATGGGIDYSTSASSISIPAGQTTATATLTSAFDGVEEGNETIVVDMGTPTNATESGTQQVTATIVDEDAVAPTVTSVSVPANGTYVAGQNLDFTVNLSENVTVNTGGGTPLLSLTVGSTTRQAAYLSGSGTSALLFRYTVQAGDADSNGIALAGTLSANGGTLRDNIGIDLNTTLNSVGSLTSVLVDAVAPTVSSVSVPANGSYKAGDNLDFTVNTSENVTVNTTGGTPQLSLTVGATTRQATYVSGSGSSALLFRYTVQTGELDSDGIAIGTLSTNGGTLRDAVSNNLNTALNSVGATGGVRVDAVAPTIGSVDVPANATYVAGQNLFFVVNATENVTVATTGGTPQLGLTIGATTRQAAYNSGSGTSALLFSYTVQSGDLDSDGITIGTLSANGGSMSDEAGNALVTALNGVGSTTAILVDAVAPTISSVATPAANTYIIGETLDFTVNTSEAVTLNTTGGTPSLPVTIGSTVRQASYLSGSGTSALLFRYTVQSGDLDSDGISLAAVATNGGTLRDAAGNNMATALNSVGNTASVLVDGIIPGVTGIALSGTPAGNAASISFVASFDETVNNLSVDDFTLTTVSGNASGAIASVSATSGSSITVTVDTLYGVGTLRLDLNSGTNVADAAGNSGVAAFTTGAIHSVNRLPSISAAQYDAATGTLVVSGSNFSALSGAANDIDVTKFSFVGEANSGISPIGGFNYASPYALASTANVEITSDSQFTIQVNSVEQANVSGLMTANGNSAANSTVYNLVVADNWLAAAPAALDIADSSNTVTVANALTLSASGTDTTRLNGTDGSASTTASGGAPTLSYAWSNGATTSSISGVVAGTYTVGVQDAVGTVRAASVTIADPVNTVGQVSLSGNAVTGQTLTALVSDSDGISGTITYQWQSGATTVGSNSTYVLQPSDEGNSLTVSVSYTDDIGYTENHTSAASAIVVSVEQNALNIISSTANSSGSTPPDADDYADAGVTDVTSTILALVNKAVSRQGNATSVDEATEIQALVDVILEGQDSDGDGLPNIFEGDDTRDTDGDAIADRDDTDADNDGIADAVELAVLFTDSDNDGILDAFDADVGNDDADGTDPGKTDANFDGVNDDVDTVGKLIALFSANADGDAYPDTVDADVDGDGITDIGMTDANSDGIVDGQEDYAAVLANLMLIDPDRDAVINSFDLDSDNDSLSDVSESGLIDRNRDGFIDEGDTVITDAALLPDTDADTVPNFLEAMSDGISNDILTGPHSGRAGQLDTNNDGVLDDATDSDGDGVADSVDPLDGFGINDDLDGDGIPDAQDPRISTSPDVKESGTSLGSLSGGLLMLLGMLGLRRARGACALAAAVLVASPCLAETSDEAFEVQLAAGIATLQPGVSSPLVVSDNHDAMWHISTGRSISENWQYQLRYADLGEAEVSKTAAIDYTVWSVLGQYTLPVLDESSFRVNAVFGVALVEGESSTLNLEDAHSTEPALGVGLDYVFNPTWRAKLESIAYGEDFISTTVGIARRF